MDLSFLFGGRGKEGGGLVHKACKCLHSHRMPVKASHSDVSCHQVVVIVIVNP